ncbi:unnamed protein product, partial [Rotaria sordida]
YTIQDQGIWPWIKTKYLTRSNWTSELLANNDTSDDQHPAKPGWEAAAQYAINWSKYVQIGAYDCASESVSNIDICQDETYPQWRIYCPLTNSTQLAFHSDRRSANTTPEDILIWSLEKLNEIADQCYGQSWPILKMIEPKNTDDLDQIVPKNITQFQLFVSDDVLLYTLTMSTTKYCQCEHSPCTITTLTNLQDIILNINGDHRHSSKLEEI